MTTAADDLPDDVVERAAKAMYPEAMSGDDPEFWKMVSRRLLAALLDAGIVTLVPDEDADAVEALRRVRKMDPHDAVAYINAALLAAVNHVGDEVDE